MALYRKESVYSTRSKYSSRFLSAGESSIRSPAAALTLWVKGAIAGLAAGLHSSSIRWTMRESLLAAIRMGKSYEVGRGTLPLDVLREGVVNVS